LPSFNEYIPPSALQATWLCVRLRVLRLLHRTDTMASRFRSGNDNFAFWRVAIVGSVIWVAFNMSHSIANKVLAHFGGAHNGPVSLPLVQAVTAQLAILQFTTLFASIAAHDPSSPEAETEWLANLPVNFSVLLNIRVLENLVASPVFLGVCALLTVYGWNTAFGYAAPLVALPLAVAVVLPALLIEGLVTTGLRAHLSRPALRDVRALSAILSALGLFVVIGLGLRVGRPALALTSALPDWWLWTVPGFAARLTLGYRTSPGVVLALLLQLGGVCILGWMGLERLLRSGLIRGGERVSHRRLRSPTRSDFLGVMPALHRFELRRLLRDRHFQVRLLLIPLLLVLVQVARAQLEHGQTPASWLRGSVFAAAGFVMGAYALLFLIQVVLKESPSLWLFYSLPCRLQEVFRKRAAFWAAVCYLFPLGALLAQIAVRGRPRLEDALSFTLAFAGIPLFALIAVSLGVLAIDRASKWTTPRVNLALTFGYFLLGSWYVSAIVTTHLWPRLRFLAFTSVGAFALWKEAQERLPLLLDAEGVRRRSLWLAEGLVAALAFNWLQEILVTGAADLGLPPSQGRPLAMVVAGLAILALGRAGRPERWRMALAPPRLDIRRSLVLGGALGLLAGLFFVTYLRWLQPALASYFPGVATARTLAGKVSLAAELAAIVAAPLFGEFIFRGLIFRGLRQFLSLTPALAISALLFSFVHPASSFPLIFVLGLSAAMAYERTRSLVPAVLCHAVYSLVVVGYGQ
jgi:ABC-2 type transport system permease protein